MRLTVSVGEAGLDPHSRGIKYEPTSLTGVVQECSNAVFRIGFPQPLLLYSLVKQKSSVLLSMRTYCCCQQTPELLTTFCSNTR